MGYGKGYSLDVRMVPRRVPRSVLSGDSRADRIDRKRLRDDWFEQRPDVAASSVRFIAAVRKTSVLCGGFSAAISYGVACVLDRVAHGSAVREGRVDAVAGQVGLAVAGALTAVYAVSVGLFNRALERAFDAYDVPRPARLGVIEKAIVELAIATTTGLATGAAAYIGHSYLAQPLTET